MLHLQRHQALKTPEGKTGLKEKDEGCVIGKVGGDEVGYDMPLTSWKKMSLKWGQKEWRKYI